MDNEELTDVKVSIRATLISSPKSAMSIKELAYEYEQLVGKGIPWREFHYRNLVEFLMSLPDIVEVRNPSHPNSLVIPIENEKSAHVNKLVKEQKVSNKKRTHARFERHRQPRRNFVPPPILHADCSKQIVQMLREYPDEEGMTYHEFDSHVQRILSNHFLQFSTEEVLNKICDVAVVRYGKVSFRRNCSAPHGMQYNIPIKKERQFSHSDSSIVDLVTDEDDIDDDEDFPSVSRPHSRQSLRSRHTDNDEDHPLISDSLIRNLRALFDDSEHKNGIWLMDLTKYYELKYCYSLVPKEHGFSDVMDLVANLPSVFFMKRYRAEGDYRLYDARRYKEVVSDTEQAEIPKTAIEELKRLLKAQKNIYTDVLLQEYGRMYHKQLKLEDFGFSNLDSFLHNLEETCHDFSFYKVKDRTMMKLNYAPVEIRSPRFVQEALPGTVTYDPFPPDVCNWEFKLDIDPAFLNLKEGETFAVIMGEIFSPGRFFVTHARKNDLLQKMMENLGEFYGNHSENFRLDANLLRRQLLCACVYSGTSEWHRAKIISTNNLKRVKVSYIDYGTVEVVDSEKLKYLHRDFAKFPPLCMQAKLSGVTQKDGGEWGENTNLQFYKITHNIRLEAELVHSSGTCLEIFLNALNGDTKIPIHEELIKRNLVDRKVSTCPTIDVIEEQPVTREKPKEPSYNGKTFVDELDKESKVPHDDKKETTCAVNNVSNEFYNEAAANRNTEGESRYMYHFTNKQKDHEEKTSQNAPKTATKYPPGLSRPLHQSENMQTAPQWGIHSQPAAFQAQSPAFQAQPQPPFPPNLSPELHQLYSQMYNNCYNQPQMPYFQNNLMMPGFVRPMMNPYPAYPPLNMYPYAHNPYTGYPIYPGQNASLATAQLPGTFRPPPGFNNVHLRSNYKTPNIPPANPITVSAEEQIPVSSLSPTNASPVSQSCHSKEHNSKSVSCTCKFCPTSSSPEPKSENGSVCNDLSFEQLSEISDDNLLEKKVESIVQKLLLKSTNNLNISSGGEERVTEDLRERRQVENKLKQYLDSVETCENKGVPDLLNNNRYGCVNGPGDGHEGTMSETNIYASEFIPKTKPMRLRNFSNECSNSFQSPSSAKKNDNIKLDPIKAFVLQHNPSLQNDNSSANY